MKIPASLFPAWAKATRAAVTGLVIGFVSPAAFAVTETTFFSVENGQVYDVDISAEDLINEGQSSLGFITASFPPAVGQLSSFNNGLGQTYGAGTAGLVYWNGTQNYGSGANLASAPQVTVAFNLDPETGGSALGYDLTNITSIYGWGDHASFNDQNFAIEWAPASDPENFTLLHAVAFGPFDPALDAEAQPASTKVVLTDLGLSGVGALRFTFTPYFYDGITEQGGQTLHEMDVFGTPTAVPEPSATALMAAGLLALAFWGRRLRRGASLRVRESFR